MKKNIKEKRMISQDIAKGLAIFLVILVHSVKVPRGIGSVIGVLFGYIMPFFLFISGYNYNDKGDSVGKNLKRRLLQLLIPFVLFSLLVFVVMGFYFFIRKDASFIEILKSFGIFLASKWSLPLFGLEFNQVLFQRILGPCWFIQFLIMADLIFIPMHSFCKDNIKRFHISIIILSLISYFLINFKIILPWGIQNAPAIAAIMLIANKLKENNSLFSSDHSLRWTIINCVICIVTIALIQLKFNGAGYFGAGELGGVLGGKEVFVFYLIALFGSYFIINFCKLLEKTNLIKKFLTFFGQHSFIILLIHMSIVHILKDIFGLPQWNAASSLFGHSTNILMELLVAVLAVVIVSFVSWWLGKLLTRIFDKNKKQAV